MKNWEKFLIAFLLLAALGLSVRWAYVFRREVISNGIEQIWLEETEETCRRYTGGVLVKTVRGFYACVAYADPDKAK